MLEKHPQSSGCVKRTIAPQFNHLFFSQRVVWRHRTAVSWTQNHCTVFAATAERCILAHVAVHKNEKRVDANDSNQRNETDAGTYERRPRCVHNATDATQQQTDRLLSVVDKTESRNDRCAATIAYI